MMAAHSRKAKTSPTPPVAKATTSGHRLRIGSRSTSLYKPSSLCEPLRVTLHVTDNVGTSGSPDDFSLAVQGRGRGMEQDARRVSDQLRHKHIRTLEVLRRLTGENQILRKRLNNETREASGRRNESRKLIIGQNSKIERVMVELQEAKAEVGMARAAEEANGLTLTALKARNKELENAVMHAEGSSKKEAERLDTQIVELREELEATVAGAREAQARARLDVFRLESEVEELRRGNGNASLHRVESAWIDEADGDETSLSQREVEDLQLSLCKATRRASTAKRQCCEFERQAKSEALRREIAESQLNAIQATKSPTPTVQRIPLPSAPQRKDRLMGGAVKTCTNTRKQASRQGARTTSATPPTDALLEVEAEQQQQQQQQQQQPPFPPQPSSSRCSDDSGDGGYPTPRSLGPATTKAVEKLPGLDMRRLRESEKRLRESNTKLQRKLSHNAKRLERAESFVSELEAELQRVAENGATFETFVVLRRENQALRMQLAEIKQASGAARARAIGTLAGERGGSGVGGGVYLICAWP
eukprot:jgi/Undpi1/1370/HiC_scaffold_11.g04762.m1